MISARNIVLLALLASACPILAKPLQIASPSPLGASRVALRFSSPARPTKPAIADVSALTQPKVPLTTSAMPFVTIDPSNQTLSLEPTALHALADLPAPVCVLGMTGTARDGKSTFLNMFSQWLRTHWATEGGQGSGFNVGHDLDTCTDGAWVRLFRGRDGEPLPGTDCQSVVLMDTQGLAKGAALGVHRLFSLSLLVSSTLGLNVMRQFNDDTLDRLGAATAHASSLLPGAPFGEHSPNLVVLLRDARLRMTQAGRSISADGMLHAALQPASDTLDATRTAIRTFFSNHTMLQMKQPDAYDLASLETRGAPQRNRPFYDSFAAAAEQLAASLQPKSVSGALLSGEHLAATAASLVEQINQGVQLSLSATVDMLRHSQAAQAVTDARRAFRQQLPELVRQVGTEGAALTGAAVALSPSTIQLKLRNATEAAVAVFASQAPNLGSRERLEPYVEHLRTSLRAMQRELEQAHEHAVRLSSLHAAHAALRDEHAAQSEFIHDLLEQQKAARQLRLQELLGNVAVVALGASATLLPPAFLSRMMPLVRGTPVALSVLGVWRVAQRSVGKFAGLALKKVKDLAGGEGLAAWGEGAASARGEAAHSAAEPVTPAFG